MIIHNTDQQLQKSRFSITGRGSKETKGLCHKIGYFASTVLRVSATKNKTLNYDNKTEMPLNYDIKRGRHCTMILKRECP